ncbi:MAG: T9SS type A sorting domain-containing protein [Lentimicrobium sp.]|jgi:hypothetical protein|nr:T9SS type A sorting domain-containing protein [Lentimicrobium sp.]
MKKILLFSFLLATCLDSFPQLQYNTLWVKEYGGSEDEYPSGSTLIQDDGFLILGDSESSDGNLNNTNYGMTDALIIKTDLEGNVEWSKNYGGSSEDRFVSGKPTPDGGYIFVGQSSSNDHDLTVNHGDYDIWVVKADHDGNIQWQKSIGDQYNNNSVDVIVDSDGYIVLCNYSSFQAFKISISGELMWQRNYNSIDGIYYFSSITSTGDGNFALAGRKLIDNIKEVVIIKIDGQGNQIWQRGFPRDNVTDVKTILNDQNNNLLIGGKIASTSYNFWALKTDSNGQIIWEKVLTSGFEELFQVSFASEGYLFSGYGSSNDNLGNFVLVTNFEGDSLKSFFANLFDQPHGDGGLTFQVADDAFITICGMQLNWENRRQIVVIKTCVGNELSVSLSDESYCPPAQLWANDGFTSYRWTKGNYYDSIYYGNSRIIDVSEGGQYNVVAYNQNGCPSYASINVPDPLYTPQRKDLCFVTADETSGKNKIIFSEINPQSVVDSIYIYRTNEYNQHVIIGRLSINENEFMDDNSIPQQHSYTYSVANLDTCGLIVGGSMHSTLHLQSSLGSNNEVNLAWNQYQGLSYEFTELYRSVFNSGIWSDYQKIAQLSVGTLSYTDINSPEGNKKYQLRITPPENCAGTMQLCSNTQTISQCSTFSVEVSSGNAHCGNDDGYIIAEANGGTEPYTFLWNGFIEGAELWNIPAGVYHLRATDAEGCTSEQTINIEKNEPEVWAESFADDIGTPECDGKIILHISEASLPAYCLINGQSFPILNDTIYNICSGNHSILLQIAECAITLEAEVYSTTGLPEGITERACKIYPVPANEKLFIGFPGEEGLRPEPKVITIYSLQGIILAKHQLYGSGGEINLTNLAEGAYILKICIRGECRVSRIIKIKD